MEKDTKIGIIGISIVSILAIGVFVGTLIQSPSTGLTKENYYKQEIKYLSDSISILSDSIVYLNTECEEYKIILKEYIENGDIILDKLDSLNNLTDSLKEELLINEFKLERIRYYNDIAKKGNNITFLRGWINRVLND